MQSQVPKDTFSQGTVYCGGDSAIGRPLNWPTVPLADTIEYDWMSVKNNSFLLCIYNLHRIKS